MGIFITDNDTFDVNFYTGSIDGRIFCTESEEEAKEKAKEYERHVVSFKKLNYGLQKKIQMAALVESEGRFLFNPIKFRTERFNMSVRKWSFKDASGAPIPVSQQTIDNLSEDVSSFLLEAFDRRVV